MAGKALLLVQKYHDEGARLLESPAEISRGKFVIRYSSIYEHSLWVAERAWDKGLLQAHDHLKTLPSIMAQVVNPATRERLLSLFIAHPDLAGKAEVAGNLTSEPTFE